MARCRCHRVNPEQDEYILYVGEWEQGGDRRRGWKERAVSSDIRRWHLERQPARSWRLSVGRSPDAAPQWLKNTGELVPTPSTLRAIRKGHTSQHERSFGALRQVLLRGSPAPWENWSRANPCLPACQITVVLPLHACRRPGEACAIGGIYLPRGRDSLAVRTYSETEHLCRPQGRPADWGMNGYVNGLQRA